MTQLLESADGADERVRRVLELLGDLVPYEQCAMLEARLGHEPHVVLVPEPSPEERVVLTAHAGRHLRAARRPGRAHLRRPAARPEEARLAVPLVGLDEVMGILLVRSSVTEYTRGAPARAVGGRGEARRLHHDPGRERRARGARPRARRGPARRRGGPRARKTSCWSWSRPSSGRLLAARPATARLDELEHKIQAQAQRLDDLLGQARLASAELRLTLREIAPALQERGSVVTWRLEAARAWADRNWNTRSTGSGPPDGRENVQPVIWLLHAVEHVRVDRRRPHHLRGGHLARRLDGPAQREAIRLDLLARAAAFRARRRFDTARGARTAWRSRRRAACRRSPPAAGGASATVAAGVTDASLALPQNGGRDRRSLVRDGHVGDPACSIGIEPIQAGALGVRQDRERREHRHQRPDAKARS